MGFLFGCIMCLELSSGPIVSPSSITCRSS
ncbi:unnamed protein product, partial [Vitis vinifera]|uniref:Uncharacterized protein n=1 Tax=Vitis vinifera TaxID=29760 RepID=D7SYY3_VITVI